VKASGKLVVTVLQGKDDDGVMGIYVKRNRYENIIKLYEIY